MITTRTAKQCDKQTTDGYRPSYTFSFGQLFRPYTAGYASLRVLNRSAGAGRLFSASNFIQRWIFLNPILDGEAEYRDSDGNHAYSG